MTKATYIKSPTGFAPKDEAAKKYWERFGLGDSVMLHITRPRSIAQHNLFWKLAEIVRDNHPDMYASKDEAADSIKLACGVSRTTHIKFNGEWFERKVPLSIAFENMKQDEFNAFFEKALDYVCTELIPGLEIDSLESEVRAAA